MAFGFLVVSVICFAIGLDLFGKFGDDRRRVKSLIGGAVLTAWGFFILDKIL